LEDTTFQEKAIAHPTDAHPRIKRRRHHGRRHTYAHQFKRARRELKFLRTRLGRIILAVSRKIEGDSVRENRFGPLLDLALRVRHHEQRQRGPKVYSLHARAHELSECGCKVSIATPATAPRGRQFVLHAKALHGNPYDGHTFGHRRPRKAHRCRRAPHL
jgi:transposase, IS5 family